MISTFFEKIDLGQVEKLVALLSDCQGLLIFSGVGKSGLVAKKIAGTLTSTGTRALSISPMDALHGDIGLVTSQDIVVLFSKSGGSDELIRLVPHLKNKGAKIVSVTCEAGSRIGEMADLEIYLPLEQELCPFDMAPTTSTVVQMIFGDLVATALMQVKNFTLDDFALNHPAGRIGKRITLKVKDVMLAGERIPLCGPKDLLVNTLSELSSKQAGCVLVADIDRQLMGIFTDGDLRRSLETYGPGALQLPVDQLMTREPRTISPHVLAWDAMQQMEANPRRLITALPVVDQGRVCGLIKLHDILQAGM
ncbi:MAG: KpsF/GutQ family sugar-phosphate isomerase [Chlamydiia bacterium]|nr:KpsF/GutQ family sugar-phosphate isomerase [Chlamydiia bacterium]